ncbi:MAG: uroporphyrinogen-III C-methyltransferase [Gammaproteobacteria bacterium]|jgi:uroporphyrin-3 C-methyltransferase
MAEQQNKTSKDNTGAGEERQRTPPQPRRGGGAWVAGSIAVLALAGSVALAGGGWYLWQRLERLSMQGADSRAELQQSINRLDRKVDEQAQTFVRGPQLDALRADTQQKISDFDTRMAGAESAVADLQRLVHSGRRAWRQAEIEYLIQVAGDELQIAHNARTALAALKAARSRLDAINDPAFLPVRNALDNDIRQLAAVSMPDVSGMALDLAGLADQVPNLPLARKAPASYGAGTDQSAAAPQAFSFKQLWHSVTHAFSQMVTVRRTETPAQPLLAPEQEYFLRQNLILKLETARLALIRRDGSNFRASLRSARNWLQTWFDTGDGSVRSAIDRLAAMEQAPVKVSLPDLSDSLARVRNIVGGGAGN